MKASQEKKDYYREYYKANRAKIALRKQQHYEVNKDTILDKNKTWKNLNKEKYSLTRKIYNETNNAKVCAQMKAWREKNKEHCASYNKFRYHTNAARRLAVLLRMHTSRAFKGKCKEQETLSLLGCTFEKAKMYIESKFKDGMSWDNHGKWHLDHIIPLGSVDLNCPLNRILVCHYSNFQPLWALDNIRKGCSL